MIRKKWSDQNNTITNSNYQGMRKVVPGLFLILLSCGFPAKAQHADSLITRAAASTGPEKIQVLLELSDQYSNQSKFLDAERTLKEALTQLQSVTLPDREEETLKARILLKHADILLFHFADYNRSLQLLLLNIDLARKTNDHETLLMTYTYLGFNYRFLKRYPQSVRYLDQAILLARQINDTSRLISCINEKANNFFLMGMDDASKTLRMEALELARKSGKQTEENFVSHDIANSYAMKGAYDKALPFFLSSFRFYSAGSDQRLTGISALNVAEAYIHIKKPDSALFYLSLANRIVTENNFMAEKTQVYQAYSEYYRALGDYPRAFDYLNKYVLLHDTIYNLEKERQISEFSARFESDQKEQENMLLKQHFRSMKMIGALSATFVFLLIIILFVNNRRKKIANRELARRNELISNQKANLSVAFDMLRHREKELLDANNSKDVFFSIIAHDLKSPFNALLGFSNLLKDEFDSFTNEEVRKFVANIADSAENIYLLVENLLAWSRTQTNRIVINPVRIDLNEKVREVISTLTPQIQKKNIRVFVNSGNPLMVSTDPGMIDFVIRNLLSNAIKYSFAGGEVRIDQEQLPQKIRVAFIDNGVGIPSENLSRLFRIDGKVKTQGTEHETGTGLGLIICKEFIEKLGGELWVENREDHGCTFFFTLPTQ